jgi:hypothetical protein
MSYVQIAEKAVAYVREKLIHGPTNIDHPRRAAGPRLAEARSFLIDRLPETTLASILHIGEAARINGAGNCGECAALAFSYLYRRDILPLDYVSYTRADHAWIVIGRPAGTDIRRPEEWGAQPVICDPWAAFDGHPGVTTMTQYDNRYDTFYVRLTVRAEKTRAAEAPV